MRRISVCLQIKILTFVNAGLIVISDAVLAESIFNTSTIRIHWELCLEARAMGNPVQLVHFFPPPHPPGALFPPGRWDPGAHPHRGFKKTPISVIFTLVSTERKHQALGMTKYLPVTSFAYFTVMPNSTAWTPVIVIDLTIYNSPGRFVYFKPVKSV